MIRFLHARVTRKTINELLNTRSKSSNIYSLKDSGSESAHRKDIPDAMNSYFCLVGKDLADKISPVANPLPSGDFEMNKLKQSSTSGLLRCRKSEMHLSRLKQQRALELTISPGTS